MLGGQASRTAQFVALNRALGHLSPEAPGFSDPVAAELLSPGWQVWVKRARARLPHSPYPFWMRRDTAVFNQFRTVVLDNAITASWPVGQLVILGAGFDGRAYRLANLSKAIVFEVDHPGTQAVKRRRASGLTPLAREIRYIGMDFSIDDLVERLSAAGHDSAHPTFWLWEGVTMYLDAPDVALTMSRAASISAPDSRIALTYLAEAGVPQVQQIMAALFGALIGEPLRSRFAAADLEALATSAGWRMLSDTGIEDWKGELAPSVVLSRREVGIQWDERIWVGRPAGPGADHED